MRRSRATRADRPWRVFVGTGVPWVLVGGIAVAAAIILLIAQNTDKVGIEWAVWEARIPLVVVILVGMLVAVVLDEIVGLVWRRRRRRIFTEREELDRLRTAEQTEPAVPPAQAVRRDPAVREDESPE